MVSSRLTLLETDPGAAVEFLRSWHGSLPESAGGGRRWVGRLSLPSKAAGAAALDDLVDSIESGTASLEELIYPSQGGVRQNVYVGVAVLKRQPPRGSRGRSEDVDVSPGFFSDWDVKDGAFSGYGDVISFVHHLDSGGIGPQIVVASGGGGVHGYYRTEEPLTPDVMTELGDRAWAYSQQQTGLRLDRLSDANRVARLPGTHWIKNGEARAVTMVRNNSGVVDLERFRSITNDAYAHIAQARAEYEARRREQAVRARLEWTPRDLGLMGDWERRYAYAAARAEINSPETGPSWAEILTTTEPPWVMYGFPDSKGRQSWTRPWSGVGRKPNPRSLVTGWEERDIAASLVSDSVELEALTAYLAVDVRHKLTRLALTALLHFDGDEYAVLNRWIAARAAGRKDWL